MAAMVMFNCTGSTPGRNTPACHAAVENRLHHVTNWRLHHLDRLGLLQMPGAVQVLAVHQCDELGVFEVIVPGEAHERFQRLARFQVVELQLLLGGADVDIGLLPAPSGTGRPCCRSSGRACACWPCACRRSRQRGRRPSRSWQTRPWPPARMRALRLIGIPDRGFSSSTIHLPSRLSARAAAVPLRSPCVLQSAPRASGQSAILRLQHAPIATSACIRSGLTRAPQSM